MVDVTAGAARADVGPGSRARSGGEDAERPRVGAQSRYAIDRRGHPRAGLRLSLDAGRPIRCAFLVMAGLLGAYVVSLIVQGEHPWPIFNDWAVAGFEIVGSALCILRGVVRRPGRMVPLTLGLGLMMWALGDLVLTILSQGGAEPPTPSWADLCYLGFFPLTYAAVLVFLRGAVRRINTPSWLDGAVAGAGAAALCSAFAFDGLARVTGAGTAELITNLSYPVADVLLLALVVGGSTVMSGRRGAPWWLMAIGITFNVVGDTANVFSAATGRTGFILDAIAWPASTVILAASVWLRPRPADVLELQRPNTFVIPGIAAAGALLILLVGNLHPTTGVAVGLAALTLVLVGVRLVRSIRAMRTLSLQRRDQSLTDELTGLRNRRYLSSVLDAFFDDYHTVGNDRSLAFLFIDLDHFKQINDTFGHVAGDELLQQIGPRMSSCLRAHDLLVRLGGDEFVVVLLDCPGDDAAEIAGRLTAALAQPFSIGTMQVTIAASIGIALAPGDADDSTSLLWCADIAMYRAKVSGLPFTTYQPELDKAGNHVHLLAELREAINDHQLTLFYQPQLDLRTGRIDAVEALVRWPHPTLGIIPPGDFLPFAEDAGLMGPITELVLNDALAQCAAWRREGHQMSVSVNVSASVLLAPGFSELVRDRLASNAVPAQFLVLEITETSVISDFDKAQHVTEQLKSFGVEVSIDDFGAGFTSLAHLSGLAVKELKLDRSLIAKLHTGDRRRNLELVRGTIELGHALGMRIVAEGIEDKETLDLLTDLGCDTAQGYLISVPKPAEQLSIQPAQDAAERAAS